MTAGVHTVAQGEHSRILSPRQAIVRTAEEWRALWAAHAGPDVPQPDVDFESRVVAAVFAGERPSPGYEIAISAEPRNAAGYVLQVRERRPPDGALAAQVITTPFHIVSLPRQADGALEFVESARAAPPVAAGARTPPRRRHEAAPSSTGLTPPAAGALAYLAGPFSGALLLATETSSRYVRFHAWQALVGLGLLGLSAVTLLGLAFLMLLFSPTLFWLMLWLSAMTAGVWMILWGVCLVQAWRGRLWKLPLAGRFAERRAGLARHA